MIAQVSGIIANIDPSLRPWFIRRYLTKLNNIYQDRALLKREMLLWRGVWVIEHILSAYRSLFSHREYHDLFMENPDTLSPVIGNPIIFRMMDDRTKHSLVQYLIDSHKKQPNRLWILEELLKSDLLRPNQRDSFYRIVMETDLQLLVESNLSFRSIVRKACDMLKDYSFIVSKEAIDYLESNMQEIHKLDYQTQMMISARIMALIKRNSYRAQEFLDSLKTMDVPDGLLVGLMYSNLVIPVGTLL